MSAIDIKNDPKGMKFGSDTGQPETHVKLPDDNNYPGRVVNVVGQGQYVWSVSGGWTKQ